MKFQYLLWIFCLLAACTQPAIEVDKTHVDVGVLKKNSAKYVDLYLINKTDRPIILKEVLSSEIYFYIQKQSDIIYPHDSLQILIVIDTKNINGKFKGQISFVTNAEQQLQPVEIKGEVAAALSIKERCLFDFGGVFFEKEMVDFGRVALGNTVSDSIWIYNPSDELLSLRLNCPEPISYVAPDELLPHDSAQIAFSLRFSDTGYLGRYTEVCPVSVGNEGGGGVLLIEAHVTADFSHADTTNAPKIKTLAPRYNFGKIVEGDSISHVYRVTNTGTSDLTIYKVESSCGCTAVSDRVRMIPPGDTIAIEVVFHSEGRHGSQQKTIKLYNNDPQKPEATLRLSGFVEKNAAP